MSLLLAGLLMGCPPADEPSLAAGDGSDSFATRDDCAGVLGGDERCAASSCAEIARTGQGDGIYYIGSGVGSYPVYCDNSIAGGGWQLISARTRDTGSLFGDEICLDDQADCSGTIPAAQIDPDGTLMLLFATADRETWVSLAGLQPPGADGLVDMITLDRTLGEANSCEYPHLCGSMIEPDVALAGNSTNFVPAVTSCKYLWATSGGLYCGAGGDTAEHLLSFNIAPYCDNAGGLDISGQNRDEFGDAACGEPGAIYFKYAQPPRN